MGVAPSCEASLKTKSRKFGSWSLGLKGEAVELEHEIEKVWELARIAKVWEFRNRESLGVDKFGIKKHESLGIYHLISF